jgi:hypothetical protein
MTENNWYQVKLPEGDFYVLSLNGKTWFLPEDIVESWEYYRKAADSAVPIIEKYKGGLKKLEELVKIQTTDGNWNYSEYMRGMANGLLVAVSVFTGKDPTFLNEPEQYLCDKEATNDRPVIAD